MLECNKISFQYDVESFDIVDGLSFAVGDEEFVSIVGASGCGKSTIFQLINGLLPLKSGTITINGKDIKGQKQYCGYMPQKDMLFPWRTIAQNLRLPLELQSGYQRELADKAVAQALTVVGLDGWGDKLPHELSGGMRQRAAFARTALTNSNLLLLDEPFSALDFLTRISMQEWLLNQWESQKKTILFITHDVEEAIFLSKTVYVVEETPIKKLTAMTVPAPYPRTRACLAQPEMVALRETIIDRLRRQEVGV